MTSEQNLQNSVWIGKRVWVQAANTEFHAVYYAVKLINDEFLRGFSGDTPVECAAAKAEAIKYAKQIDQDLE